MLSPAGGFYVPKGRDPFRSRKAGPLLRRVTCWMAGRRGDAMADNIPSGVWSGSDAMDRLRVAIENHQKATERQTTTTRWLNVVMTALTILMTVPTVVQIWRAYSEIWPVVRLWRPW
jgi:hypothetical protein